MSQWNKKYIIIAVCVVLLQSMLLGQGWLKTRMIRDQLKKAVVHFNEKNYVSAERTLKPLIEADAGKYTSTTMLLLIKTSVMLEKDEQAMQLGRDFLRRFPKSTYLSEVYLSYGDIFIRNGDFSSAFRMYLKSRKILPADTLLTKIDRRLVKTMKYTMDETLLDERLSVEYDSSARAILFLAKSYNQLAKGHHDESAITLNRIQPEAVPDIYFDVYERLILATYRRDPKNVQIGVVLPLSGQHKTAGRSFLAGLRYTAADTGRLLKLSYLVYDNQSRDIETIRAIQALKKNKNVLTIVGPISEQNSLIAANTMTDSKLPLIIPNSTQNGLTELSSFVFQMNSNLELRGRFAARTAVLELGLDSIAVLSPSDEKGQQLTEAFLSELNILGKEPVAVEWYSETPEDLTRQFKVIRSRAWELLPMEKETDEFLGMEIDSLDALFDVSGDDFFDLPETKEKVMTSRDSSRVVLNTIDAIYMPIVSEHLRYIATQFPMYNLSATVIGNEAWQNLDILNEKNIGPHLDSMIVITPTYKTTMHEGMSVEESYYYSQGLDCAKLLMGAMETSRANRNSVWERLASTDEYHGDGKIISFTGTSRNVNTALQVLRYHRSAFHSLGYFKGDSLRYLRFKN